MTVPDEDYNQQLTVVMTEIATKMQVLLDKQDELAVKVDQAEKDRQYDREKTVYEAGIKQADTAIERVMNAQGQGLTPPQAIR